MIAYHRLEEVRRLLAEGNYSARAIARMTQVSRNTVSRILRGEIIRTPEETDLPPPERCPTCGRLMYGTCRACEVERVKKSFSLCARSSETEEDAAEKTLPAKGSKRKKRERKSTLVKIRSRGGSLPLYLTSEERERYLEIRSRKEAEEAARLNAYDDDQESFFELAA